MKPTLDKKEIINSTYEILLYIDSDLNHEQYRVKTKDGKIYFLKLYNSAKLQRQDFIENELFEVKILSFINDDGIIKFVNSGNFIKNNQKFHFIVFEFISGETLQDKLSREFALSQYYAESLILDILDIIKILHTNKNAIIHNYINPSSIYLDYLNGKEKPKLTNFRYARYITNKSSSLNINQLQPFFVAPELYNGIFTPQSDIFSAGALLYNLITGIAPWYFELPKYQYTNENFIDLISKKRYEPLDFKISKFEIDEGLKNVIKTALALNIDDRFKNIDEFISALKRKNTYEITQNKTLKEKPIKKEGAGFLAIAGMQKLKDLLYNDVIRALNEKELYASYGLTIPNGMLLYGPPGCGKTFIAERFAQEVGFNFLQLKPSDIKSKYINETEEKIALIFKEAQKNAPTIIFIDEIDAVVPNREANLHQMQAAPVNEFLTQMSDCSKKGIFIIAASNRPEKIDPAILRTGRIDKIFYLSPPDYDARIAMFKLYLKTRPVDIGLDYDKLAKITQNYVSSDIKFLIDEASRVALQSKSRITQVIFDKVISQTKPSISNQELKKYEILKEKLENNNL